MTATREELEEDCEAAANRTGFHRNRAAEKTSPGGSEGEAPGGNETLGVRAAPGGLLIKGGGLQPRWQGVDVDELAGCERERGGDRGHGGKAIYRGRPIAIQRRTSLPP